MTTYLIPCGGALLALYSIALAISTSHPVAADFFKLMAILIAMGVVGFMHKSGFKNQF